MTKKQPDDPVEDYRRVRKPVAPPQRAEPDRRRDLAEEQARREAEEALEEEDDEPADEV